MARPRKLDESSRRLVLSEVLHGANLDSAARAAGCSPRTVRREARRDSLFAWRLRCARDARDKVRRELAGLEGLGRGPLTRSALVAHLAQRLRVYWGEGRGGETPNREPSIT
jgi:hypothetical protein